MKYSTVSVTIPVGESSNSEELLLEPGNVFKVLLFENGTIPNSGADIKITTKRGDEIHPFVPFEEFKPRGGGSHMDAAKDLKISGNQVIKIFVNTPNNIVTSDFTTRVLFYHEE